MSVTRTHRSARRTARNREHFLAVERLEDRRLLTTADFGGDDGAGPWILDPNDYAPQSLMVRFRDDICSAQGCTGLGLVPLPWGAEVDAGQALLPSLRHVKLPDHVTVESALQLLQGRDAVLYAEPDYRIQLNAVPNDPDFDRLWGLNNDGQEGGTIDADIDAPEAWDSITGSGSTIVAVIDTGVDIDHEDLVNNMWVNPGEIAGDGLDNDGNGYVDDIHGYDFVNNDGNPNDDHNHGTHVAGTIAGQGNNGIGVTGINWNAKIMALKFLNSQGSGDTSDAILALNYAVANGATVSNNSWGMGGGFSQSLYDAIAAARDADHVFVAAAGNGNWLGIGQDNDTTPFWPGNFNLPNIISVAAVDRNDNKPLFSNYGANTVDLAAPGVDIYSTLRNNGYGLMSGTSMAAPHVAGVVALVRDLHPDWSYAQVVNQVLQTVDPVDSMQGITVTGGRLNAAAAVGVEVEPAPEIKVSWQGANLVDGSGVVDYGSTPPGLSIAYSFTIENRGVLPLNLVEPISVPAGFSVTSSFGTTTVPVGESTTFVVQLDGAVEGSYSGTVSFVNDDPDENPFDFTVSGTVAIPPAVQIVDNGDASFSAVGDWIAWSNQGYQNDIHESMAGSGSDIARWTFDRLLPGDYRVAATWTSYTNRATNAPFTVLDGDTALATVDVNQQVLPDGFSDAGAQWQYLAGPYSIAGHTLAVELSDAADGRLNADAIRIERIDPVPEIEVRYQGVSIEDGVTTLQFGTTLQGVPLNRTFTVRNSGGAALTLDEPVSLPEGFSLDASFGTTTLSTDESTTFTVSMDAAIPGTFVGDISFGNNDSDESPFTFTVQGTVQEPPEVQIMDNGDAGFATVGAWTRWTGQGYQSDIHESLPGTGSDVASWTFTNLLPAYYRVAATWTSHSNRASNAPFELLDGGTSLASVPVNQRVLPNDFADAGVNWENLGGTLLVTSGSLTVRVHDGADGRLNADAIRIERVPPAAEIEVFDAADSLTDGSSTVDFGSTAPGAPVVRTFIVRNTGTETLVLDEPITVTGEFSLASSFGTTSLAAGAATEFSVRLEATTEGIYSGDVSFTNNDGDESPFDFAVTGTVVVPPAVQIVDDGDAGFATVGEWKRWTGQGYLNDIDESLPGTGVDVASWTFDGLIPGRYRVAATWKEYSNRASNAPFTVLDGTTPLTTAYVNQRVAPDDFAAAGANWHQLGGIHEITGNNLIVRLHDAADGRLNADAIRIERLNLEPEIQVTQAAVELEDGTSVVNFGSTAFGTAVATTFTVTNLGGAPLELGTPVDVPAGFSVTSSFGSTTLNTDESTTFVVQLDATSIGTFSGLVVFGNNDADEAPFEFTVEGTVLSPPAVVVVDNGDAGFSSVGEWTRWTGQGYLNDIHESRPGTGIDVASWMFTNLVPGSYRVAATWTAYTNRATNAPFTILDDTVERATVTVNQRLAPGEFADGGVLWNELGGLHQIDSGTLVVRLNDAADGRLNADAIRIERIDGAAGGASFDGGGSGSDVLAAAAIPVPTGSRHLGGGAAEGQLGRIELIVSQGEDGTSLMPGGPAVWADGAQRPADRVLADWPDREEIEDLLDDLVGDLNAVRKTPPL